MYARLQLDWAVCLWQILNDFHDSHGVCASHSLSQLHPCCRAGSLNAAKCEELGVHGHYRTLLKAGETITTRAGLTVHPEEVHLL